MSQELEQLTRDKEELLDQVNDLTKQLEAPNNAKTQQDFLRQRNQVLEQQLRHLKRGSISTMEIPLTPESMYYKLNKALQVAFPSC